jgi:hypothetical protein
VSDDRADFAEDFGEWIDCCVCFGRGMLPGCFEDTCCCTGDPDDPDYCCAPEPCDFCRGKGGWKRDRP